MLEVQERLQILEWRVGASWLVKEKEFFKDNDEQDEFTTLS